MLNGACLLPHECGVPQQARILLVLVLVLDFIAGFDYENDDEDETAIARTLDFGLRALDFNLSSDVADAQIIRFPG